MVETTKTPTAGQEQNADPLGSSAAPGYALDIVDAGITANKCIAMLDGTPAGDMRALVAIRSAIFAAFHLGHEAHNNRIETQTATRR